MVMAKGVSYDVGGPLGRFQRAGKAVLEAVLLSRARNGGGPECEWVLGKYLLREHPEDASGALYWLEKAAPYLDRYDVWRRVGWARLCVFVQKGDYGQLRLSQAAYVSCLELLKQEQQQVWVKKKEGSRPSSSLKKEFLVYMAVYEMPRILLELGRVYECNGSLKGALEVYERVLGGVPGRYLCLGGVKKELEFRIALCQWFLFRQTSNFRNLSEQFSKEKSKRVVGGEKYRDLIFRALALLKDCGEGGEEELEEVFKNLFGFNVGDSGGGGGDGGKKKQYVEFFWRSETRLHLARECVGAREPLLEKKFSKNCCDTLMAAYLMSGGNPSVKYSEKIAKKLWERNSRDSASEIVLRKEVAKEPEHSDEAKKAEDGTIHFLEKTADVLSKKFQKKKPVMEGRTTTTTFSNKLLIKKEPKQQSKGTSFEYETQFDELEKEGFGKAAVFPKFSKTKGMMRKSFEENGEKDFEKKEDATLSPVVRKESKKIAGKPKDEPKMDEFAVNVPEEKTATTATIFEKEKLSKTNFDEKSSSKFSSKFEEEDDKVKDEEEEEGGEAGVGVRVGEWEEEDQDSEGDDSSNETRSVVVSRLAQKWKQRIWGKNLLARQVDDVLSIIREELQRDYYNVEVRRMVVLKEAKPRCYRPAFIFEAEACSLIQRAVRAWLTRRRRRSFGIFEKRKFEKAAAVAQAQAKIERLCFHYIERKRLKARIKKLLSGEESLPKTKKKRGGEEEATTAEPVEEFEEFEFEEISEEGGGEGSEEELKNNCVEEQEQEEEEEEVSWEEEQEQEKQEEAQGDFSEVFSQKSSPETCAPDRDFFLQHYYFQRLKMFFPKKKSAAAIKIQRQWLEYRRMRFCVKNFLLDYKAPIGTPSELRPEALFFQQQTFYVGSLGEKRRIREVDFENTNLVDQGLWLKKLLELNILTKFRLGSCLLKKSDWAFIKSAFKEGSAPSLRDITIENPGPEFGGDTGGVELVDAILLDSLRNFFDISEENLGKKKFSLRACGLGQGTVKRLTLFLESLPKSEKRRRSSWELDVSYNYFVGTQSSLESFEKFKKAAAAAAAAVLY